MENQETMTIGQKIKANREKSINNLIAETRVEHLHFDGSISKESAWAVMAFCSQWKDDTTYQKVVDQMNEDIQNYKMQVCSMAGYGQYVELLFSPFYHRFYVNRCAKNEDDVKETIMHYSGPNFPDALAAYMKFNNK